MARLRLEFPGDRVLFTTRLEVRIGDVNYGNHLGHDRVVTLLHEARVRFLAGLGLGELDCGGLRMVIADLAVVYLAEVLHGQELRVEIAADDVGRSSCDLLYRASDARSGAAAAVAKTRIVFLETATQRVASLPDRLREAVAAEGRLE
jgi:acyl-CoA thioesterase FadM